MVKGVDCFYELTVRTNDAMKVGDLAPNNVKGQIISNSPEVGDSLQARNVFDEDNIGVSDAFDLHNDFRDVENELPELLLPLHVDEPLIGAYDGVRNDSSLTVAPLASKDVSFDSWDWPHAFIQPRIWDASQAPWAAWTTSVATCGDVRDANGLTALPGECLTLLQPSSLVVQHNTSLIMQALRAYPLMMLRRETLPPFIHPHWHRSGTTALPEPISNCMSIPQMYAFRSEETKPFLWRTIKAEDEYSLAQVSISRSQVYL